MQLYQSGARNFLFLNVPPIDRSPGTISQGVFASLFEAATVKDFNSRLANLAQTLRSAHADSTVFYFDTNLLFTRVLDHPSSYTQTEGYRNTNSFCVSYEK